MIKKAILLIAAAVIIFALMGASDCSTGNKQLYDNVDHFDEAIIKLPNGEIVQGQVESWNDFADGDQLQIRIDGVWYLIHSTNATLISHYYEQP